MGRLIPAGTGWMPTACSTSSSRPRQRAMLEQSTAGEESAGALKRARRGFSFLSGCARQRDGSRERRDRSGVIVA